MKTVVGLLNTIREAESAIVDVINSGFGRETIKIMAGEDERREFMSGTSGYADSGWMDLAPLPVESSSLTAMGLPDEDAHFFVEGVENGGFLVAVAADDDRAEKAADILRRHQALDAESRDTSRRPMARAENGSRIPTARHTISLVRSLPATRNSGARSGLKWKRISIRTGKAPTREPGARSRKRSISVGIEP